MIKLHLELRLGLLASIVLVTRSTEALANIRR
jgi:hypothetical protein